MIDIELRDILRIHINSACGIFHFVVLKTMEDAQKNPKDTESESLLENLKKSERASFVVGVIARYSLASLVVVFLTGGSLLGAELQVTNKYAKPFWLTYSTSSFITILLLVVFLQRHKLPSTPTQKTLFISAAPFSFLWICANYLYALSFNFTSVASILSIEQLATVLVFFLSLIVLKEQFSILKTLFLFMCIIGVVMVAISDMNEERTGLMGDFFMVLSTICSALYMVFFKKQFLHSSLSLLQVMTFLGYIGVWITILYWPFIIIAHFTELERFQMPHTDIQWILYVANLFITLLFNGVLNWGIASITPLFMRMVVITSIPLGALFNYILYGTDLTALWISGACLIFVGFTCFAITEEWYRRKQPLEAHKS